MSNDARHRVMVSGASAGIGQAIAQHLLSIGWHVMGLDIAQPAIQHAHYQHHLLDLTDVGATERLLLSVDVSAFVHAAGILRVGRLGQLDLQGGAQMWQLHVQAAAVIGNAIMPRMVEKQYGRLVLIGSRVSQGLPGRSQYAATKSALVAMAKSWAAEVASSGVTVNVISPAATETSMLHDPLRAGSQPRLPPIGRLIQPQEIADLVAYLLSSSASAITGQEITICGGSSLNQ